MRWIQNINKFILWIGNSISWLSFLLVIIIIIDVLLRYLFNNTKTWILELEWHLFALIFLFGSAMAYQKDEHVRVDLFYSKFTQKQKLIVDLLGDLILLVPWTIVVTYYAINYGLNAFAFNEGSPNPGGLPARYIIKFCIAIGFALLFLQGLMNVILSIKRITLK